MFAQMPNVVIIAIYPFLDWVQISIFALFLSLCLAYRMDAFLEELKVSGVKAQAFTKAGALIRDFISNQTSSR